jgi:hypothetical protein
MVMIGRRATYCYPSLTCFCDLFKKNDEEIIMLLSEDEFMLLASVIDTRCDKMQRDILSLTVLHVCNMLFPCKRRVKSRLDPYPDLPLLNLICPVLPLL